MVATLTSCQDHDFYSGGDDGDGTAKEIAISVVLPYMGGSRATYDIGDTYENSVNLDGHDFRLLLFDFDNNTLICSFDPENVEYDITNSLAYSVCTMRAKLNENLMAYSNLRMVMLANWGDYPEFTEGVTTIDDLAGYVSATGAISTDEATTFSASGQLVASDGHYIPLYGVAECKNIGWHATGEYVPLGYLWLLRSVAKIEVKSADRLPPIESVELTRYNAKGTCAPRGIYSEQAYVASVAQYKPSNYVTLPGGKNDVGTKNYQLVNVSNQDETFVVYVPEHQILSDYSKPKDPMADRPVLNVKFKGVEQTYQVEFKYYTDEAAADEGSQGDYFDIRRNYIYRYELRLEGNGLRWDVDVLPYTSVDLKPNFGLMLDAITLNKYVAKLYTDPNGPTSSQETITAYDENNRQLTASNVQWRLSESITNHVCTVVNNPDGTCTILPKESATGRDIVEAVTTDKNGFEVIAECIVEVTERHLGLEKTFLGLIPYDILPDYSYGSFRVNIVAERDDYSTLSWELVDANDKPLPAEKRDLVTVTAEGDGGTLNSGDNVSEKIITVYVQANSHSKLGEVHLMLKYNGPEPGTRNDPNRRREYTTYCDITVSNVSLTVYPTVLNMTVGQQSSVTARTAPVFSDYIPALAFESEDINIVTVDDNGLVTAVGHGTTRIKVSSPDDLLNWIAPEYVDVNVTPDDLVLLRYDGTPADYVELLGGQKLQLRAFSHGVDVSKDAVWEIVDANVDAPYLTIQDGLLTANTDVTGTSTVRVTYDSYSETCIVVVAAERKLIISEFPKAVTEHATVPMKAYVFPDSTPYDRRQYDVAWKSSDVNIVAFDDPSDKSLAVAKTLGTVTITATTTYDGQELKATADIAVLDIEQDLKQRFNLFVYDTNGNKIAINSVVGTAEKDIDKIYIPNGKTWTAEIEFYVYNDKVTELNSTYTITTPYSWYNEPERISVQKSNDGMSFSITTKTSAQVLENRYNILTIKFVYEGVEYNREFWVYHKY